MMAIVMVCMIVSVMQRRSMSAVQTKNTMQGEGSQQEQPQEQEEEQEQQSTSTTTNDKSDKRVWTEQEFVSYMEAHPNRNYFPHFFSKGGLRSGVEVGVAEGRFSELFLKENVGLTDAWSWTMVDPVTSPPLLERMNAGGSWEKAGYLKPNVQLQFHKKSSLDPSLLSSLADDHYDFVYLDGLHSHENVEEEMPLYWKKVKPGGILAGHDYCNYGEAGLGCKGCQSIPACAPYTEYGKGTRGAKTGRAANQNGVVMAVQEWLVEHGDDRLTVHHTIENFTRESLQQDGFEYDMVLRKDRNPSWFIYKPKQ